MKVFELNLDGLVGPTHHYGGLALGNMASTSNALHKANPAAAAHQGIQKMRLLHQMGIKQGVLPPHQRPNLQMLHQLGFKGKPAQQIEQAFHSAPNVLSACYSASSMWTANAATVSPSSDSDDHRVHFTAANLVSHLHRHQEAAFSSRLLQELFADERYFQHHSALPPTGQTSDEGAANHSRLCSSHAKKGLHVFVYGKRATMGKNSVPHPHKFPARQSLEASEAIARNHKLPLEQTLYVCQDPFAIDQGVFHNDVIAVANESLLVIHEKAWMDQESCLLQLKKQVDFPLQIIQINEKELSVAAAVSTYLFNSQLVTLPDSATHQMVLIAPTECEQHPKTRKIITQWITDPANPISYVYYLDLKQSMHNGGGPACLRLRMPLTEMELQAMHQGILVNDVLLDRLDTWIDNHYRTQLYMQDLADPSLMDESLRALDELTSILQLGPIYPFQRETTS
jgi:succinylarginine dihydrolase